MPIVKVTKRRKDAQVPKRASNGAIGYDVYASVVLDKDTKEVISGLPIEINPGDSALIGIGVRFAIPMPWQCEVRPRSGLASKHDIELSNSPGTIDPDFRGEAGVLLRNRGKNPFVVEEGMRVAQLIFSEVKVPVFEEVEELSETLRGSGGFGSTGLFEIAEGTEEYQRAIKEKDRFYMKIVALISERSRCVKGVPKDDKGQYLKDEEGNWKNQTKKFGCLIVKGDNIISMGFNAPYRGADICSEKGCLRENEEIPSGSMMERCRTMHPEMNAFSNLLVSGGTSSKGADMYLNIGPCDMCAKLIVGSGIENVILLEGVGLSSGLTILKEAGINIRHV